MIEHFSNSAFDSFFSACQHKYELNYLQRLSAPKGLSLVTGSAVDDAVSWAYQERVDHRPLPPVSAIVGRMKHEYFSALLEGLNLEGVSEEVLLAFSNQAAEDPMAAFKAFWESSPERFTGVRFSAKDDPMENFRIVNAALEIYADEHMPAINPKYVQRTLLVEIPGVSKPMKMVLDLFTQESSLIDLKTSSSRKPDDWVKKSTQLSTYQWGMERLGEPVKSLGYHILVKTKKPGVQIQKGPARSKTEIDDFERVLAMRANVILNQRVFPPCPWDALSNPCSWCDFGPAGLCKFRPPEVKDNREDAIED